ncbi:MAG: hypothetical protein GF329_11905 [Candidatus Lokiarchaeota archaeon]|nr:hypothetical protein [Candidatus Lokiarchaeota archaeon]
MSSGPYGIIRHPGYLSLIFGDLGFLFMIG